MDFDATQWLQDHADDPVKALNALAAKRDEEGKAAARARTQRDDAKTERDALQDRLTDAEKRAAPAGATVLTGEDATAWQTFKERGGLTAFDEAEKVKTEKDKLTRELTTQRAASAFQVAEDDLIEWLAERELTPGKTKDAEGKDVDTYGLTVEGAFKPLSEFKTFAALTTAEGKPKGKSAPTGLIGDKSKPPSIAREQNARAASHLRPKSN